MAERECGFNVCEFPDGSMSRGKKVCGTSYNVDVPNNCPAGSKRVAITHNHPSGDSSLSGQDKSTAERLKIQVCVKTQGEETRCYRVKPNR